MSLSFYSLHKHKHEHRPRSPAFLAPRPPQFAFGFPPAGVPSDVEDGDEGEDGGVWEEVELEEMACADEEERGFFLPHHVPWTWCVLVDAAAHPCRPTHAQAPAPMAPTLDRHGVLRLARQRLHHPRPAAPCFLPLPLRACSTHLTPDLRCVHIHTRYSARICHYHPALPASPARVRVPPSGGAVRRGRWGQG
ncbi:hypothetical protein B0H14DRAFT_1212432 [Mycena olivaceomarginata]|nr:hypothetical protein B0H14DRAFT_1212432 [Mycena olivaceomarginata]